MIAEFDSFTSLDDTPAYIIHRVARRLRVQLWRFLQQYDAELTPEKWFILMRCLEQPGISQIELSDQVLNDQPNIKRLVDSLVQQGLLERHKHNIDQRRYRIYLSVDGLALLERLKPDIVALRRQIFGAVEPGRLRAAFSTLEEIERGLPGMAEPG